MNEFQFKDILNLKFLIQLFLLIFFIVVFLKFIVFDFNIISSDSMSPTLIKGDNVVISRLAYFVGLPYQLPFSDKILNTNLKIWFKSPKIDDIIVFVKNENNESKKLVKRIAAIPNDTLLFNVNSKALRLNNDYPFEDEIKVIIPDEDSIIEVNYQNYDFYYKYIQNESPDALNGDNYKFTKIFNYKFKDKYYFVLGDNIDNSYDSRDFGLINSKTILGKPIMIFLSTNQDSLRSYRFLKIIE